MPPPPTPLALWLPPLHLSPGHWPTAWSEGWEGPEPPGIPPTAPSRWWPGLSKPSSGCWPWRSQEANRTWQMQDTSSRVRPPQFPFLDGGPSWMGAWCSRGFSGGLPSRNNKVLPPPAPGPSPGPAPLHPPPGPRGAWQRPSSWTSARLWRRRVSAAQGKAPGPAPPPRAIQAGGLSEPFPGRYFGPLCELRGAGRPAAPPVIFAHNGSAMYGNY